MRATQSDGRAVAQYILVNLHKPESLHRAVLLDRRSLRIQRQPVRCLHVGRYADVSDSFPHLHIVVRNVSRLNPVSALGSLHDISLRSPL